MNNTLDLANIFLTFLVIKTLVELILNLRNQNSILKYRMKVPLKFAEKISLAEHQKAAAYSLTNGRFNQKYLIFQSFLLGFWTVGGGLEKLQHLLILALNSTGSLAPSIESQQSLFFSILFIFVFGLCQGILSLPFDLYSTFVIEEKFGFNKTTIKIYLADMIKQIILSLIIMIPLLTAIIWFMRWSQYWWIFSFVVITLFQLFMMWIYPTFIAPWFNQFTPLADGETKNRILELAKKVNFQTAGIFVMDASKRSGHGNAYFSGFGKKRRIVFYDTLIQQLNADELEAVMAHELGHFKLNHILGMMVKSVVFSFLTFFILGKLATSSWFFSMHGVSSSEAMLILLASQVLGVYTFFLTPLFSYFSRKNEFAADQFAAHHSNAQQLISALVKMYKDNASSLTPDPIYAKWYYSHPPAFERISRLEKS